MSLKKDRRGGKKIQHMAWEKSSRFSLRFLFMFSFLFGIHIAETLLDDDFV
jgi:hypothetical protein